MIPAGDADRGAPLPGHFASRNTVMQRALALARRAAACQIPVLLVGESGTGKRVLAGAIHAIGRQRGATFVSLRCGGVDGSPSSAERIAHAFETAGTVFFDEIGELSPPGQGLLLATVERHRAAPPASSARPIAATTHALDDAVRDGRFRGDLLQQLGTVTIALPPLRERREDLADLTTFILQRLAKRHRRGTLYLSPELHRFVATHAWPGNLRELEHTLERWVVLASGDRITGRPTLPVPASTPVSLEELERSQIAYTLRISKTLREAAARLGIDTSTLWRKRRRFGLS